MDKLSSIPKNVSNIYNLKYKYIIESLRKQAEDAGNSMVLFNLLDDYSFLKGTPREIKNFIENIERELLDIKRGFNKMAREIKIAKYREQSVGQVDIDNGLTREYIEARVKLIQKYNNLHSKLYDSLGDDLTNKNEPYIAKLQKRFLKQLESLDTLYGLSNTDRTKNTPRRAITRAEMGQLITYGLSREENNVEKFKTLIVKLQDEAIITKEEFDHIKDKFGKIGKEVPQELVFFYKSIKMSNTLHNAEIAQNVFKDMEKIVQMMQRIFSDSGVKMVNLGLGNAFITGATRKVEKNNILNLNSN
jgi:hypothetical protein